MSSILNHIVSYVLRATCACSMRSLRSSFIRPAVIRKVETVIQVTVQVVYGEESPHHGHAFVSPVAGKDNFRPGTVYDVVQSVHGPFVPVEHDSRDVVLSAAYGIVRPVLFGWFLRVQFLDDVVYLFEMVEPFSWLDGGCSTPSMSRNIAFIPICVLSV